MEKVKLLTQSSNKIFDISIFIVGGFLATCSTYRPILTLDPQQSGSKTCETKTYSYLIDDDSEDEKKSETQKKRCQDLEQAKDKERFRRRD